MIENIVPHLCSAQKRLQLRQTAIFYKVDEEEYGSRVAEGFKLDLSEVKRLAAIELSSFIIDHLNAVIIGFLVIF